MRIFGQNSCLESHIWRVIEKMWLFEIISPSCFLLSFMLKSSTTFFIFKTRLYWNWFEIEEVQETTCFLFVELTLFWETDVKCRIERFWNEVTITSRTTVSFYSCSVVQQPISHCSQLFFHTTRHNSWIRTILYLFCISLLQPCLIINYCSTFGRACFFLTNATKARLNIPPRICWHFANDPVLFVSVP